MFKESYNRAIDREITPEKRIGSPDATAISIIHPWLKHTRAYAQIPGLAVGIATENVNFKQGYGITGETKNNVMTPDTPFRVSSITKLFVAASIMKLADQGKLDISDTIQNYLPWVQSNAEVNDKFTVKHLLSHLAGINRNIPGKEMGEEFPDSHDLKSQVENEGIVLFEPGKKYKYSNLGYILLGEIIKSVDGRDWGEYLQKEIIEPLNLTNTTIDNDMDSRELINGFEVYMPPEMLIRKDKERKKMSIKKSNGYAPAMGMVTTVTDMLTFLKSFFPGDNRILSEKAKNEMFQVHRGSKGKKVAIGFHVDEKLGSTDNVFGHGGMIGGFQTYAGIDLKNRIASVVLGNASSAPVEPITQGIFKTIDYVRNNLKEDNLYDIPDNVDISHLKGLYKFKFYNTEIINTPQNKLIMVDYYPPYYPYDPTKAMAFLGYLGDEDRFIVGEHPSSANEVVTFHRDPNGKVDSFERVGEIWTKGLVTADI